MKLSVLILISLVMLIGCKLAESNKGISIDINGKTIFAEAALTASQHYQGLSNRTSLAEDRGMIFIFDKPAKREFVMRDMLFPLDILWINGDKIVFIAKNLLPEGSNTKNVYGPEEPVDKVLEVNAGLADKYGWQIGQTVILK